VQTQILDVIDQDGMQGTASERMTSAGTAISVVDCYTIADRYTSANQYTISNGFAAETLCTIKD
jgi:hypothetical protein